jgi:hypothetical protein
MNKAVAKIINSHKHGMKSESAEYKCRLHIIQNAYEI